MKTISRKELFEKLMKSSGNNGNILPIIIGKKKHDSDRDCKETRCKGRLTGPLVLVTDTVRVYDLCIVFSSCRNCGRLHSLEGKASFTAKSKRLFLKKGSSTILVKNKRNRKTVEKFTAYVVGTSGKKKPLPNILVNG
ncbi:MAG: hypothetical protein NT148_00980 [Candidatus Nealsonbacteria bacterium]|nr:hypothetical protein [Candidatus Nealsonbacteria bacterium]